MREIMYNLLSYEPLVFTEGQESDFINYVLDNDVVPTDNPHLAELFQGYLDFYHKRVQDKSAKKPIAFNLSTDLEWLRLWKSKYHTNNRLEYPVLFKKICYYIIVTEDLTDKDFMSAINYRVNKIGKWNIYTSYRREAEKHNHLALRFTRNGKKQEYLTDIIESMYFECHRQLSGVGQAPKRWESPVFVDVFTGTGSVAASINIPSEKKVLNDFDKLMIATIFIISRYKEELAEQIFEYHTKALNGLLKEGYYSREDADRHIQFYYDWHLKTGLNIEEARKNEALFTEGYWDKPTLFVNDEERKLGKEQVPDNVEVFYQIRNLFKYCEQRVQNYELKSFDYNDTSDMGAEDLNELVDLVACNYIYLSFFGNVSDNTPEVSRVDFSSYGKLLETVFNEKVERNAKGFRGISFPKYPMKSLDAWVDSLKNAVIGSLSFEELYVDDKAFYYHDSPYFNTKQYEVKFSDDMHVLMQNKLRGSDFKWLFSMQFFKGNVTGKKVEGANYIKDYYTYYTGFVSELKLEGNVYKSTYPASKVDSSLYVTFVDKTGGKQATHPEMFISNFETYSVFPYLGDCIQMPFEEFLTCVKEGMDYKSIRGVAIQLTESRLRSYLK